ncbi:hypothetical protein ACVI1J_005570 [Bradyrhizobium diazoefficiens]
MNSRHNLNTSNVQFGHGKNRIASESLIAALAAFTFVGCVATTTRLWPIDHNSARYFAALDAASRLFTTASDASRERASASPSRMAN